MLNVVTVSNRHIWFLWAYPLSPVCWREVKQ